MDDPDRPRTLRDLLDREKEENKPLKRPTFFKGDHPGLTDDVLDSYKEPTSATTSRLVPLGIPQITEVQDESKANTALGNYFATHPAGEAIRKMRAIAPGTLPYYLTYDLIGSPKSGLPLQNLDMYHQQRALRLAIILNLTETCFKTCIPLRIPARFSADNINCLHYCVKRRLESDIYVTNRMTNELSGLDFNNIDLTLPTKGEKAFYPWK